MESDDEEEGSNDEDNSEDDDSEDEDDEDDDGEETSLKELSGTKKKKVESNTESMNKLIIIHIRSHQRSLLDDILMSPNQKRHESRYWILCYLKRIW